MPSPSKRYSQRSSPSRNRAASNNSSDNETEMNQRKTAPEILNSGPSSRGVKFSADGSTTSRSNNQEQQERMDIGKRTGIQIPARGTSQSIPIDNDGYEDLDKFFDSAKSPAPPGLSNNSSANSGARGGGGGAARGATGGARGGGNNKKQSDKEKRNQEKHVRHEELLKEGSANARQRPDLLNNEQGANSNQQTPRNPTWSNRLMHQAMGVPVGDSPDVQAPDTVGTALSKVSTAAPSTAASQDTIATESRHALRGERASLGREQLEQLGGKGSPEAEAAEQEEEEEEDEGPMDPPEEEDFYTTSGGKKGVDPEERDDIMEPEEEEEEPVDALENSLEEVVQNNEASFDNSDDGGVGGGMQLATQDFDDDVNFDNDGGGGFEDDNQDDDEEVSAKTSQKSRASSKASSAKSEEEEESEEEPPKKKKSKKKKQSEDSSSAVTPTSVLRTKKSKKKKNQTTKVNWSTPNGTSKGIPMGNRNYEAIPVSDYKEDYPEGEEPKTPGGSALRRSRRARFAPLQFWKNEKLIYEAQNEKGLLGEAMGDMPVVAGVMHALPTPYKEVKRKEVPKKKGKDKKKRKRGDDSDSEDDESTVAKTPFDDKAIRKKFRINNGESGSVWSETLESATDIKIVSRIDNRTFSKLPLSSTRKKRESKVVGFASQAFHVPTDDDDLFPGYIAGNVVLPPRGIKDAEGVGLCSQVFNVGDCQPNSLEFALADPSGQDGEFDPKTAQRYLLNKGDMFQIPPGNVYRIENHSKTVKATLFWTIIKCTSRAEQEDDSEEDD